VGQSAFAQSKSDIGSPFIMRYDNREAGGQFWCAVQDKRGLMYFGTDSGILEFDGIIWTMISPPGLSMVRALALAKDGFIYYGASEDFGYLEASNGRMKVVSLCDKLSTENKKFGDIWYISTNSQGVYFCSNKNIFRYNKGMIQLIAAGFQIPEGYTLNDSFIYVDLKHGLCHLDGEHITPLPQKTTQKKPDNASLVPFGNNKMLVAWWQKPWEIYNLNEFFDTTTKRLNFKRNPTSSFISKFDCEAFHYIKNQNNQFVGIHVIDDKIFAISTEQSGILICDYQGRILRRINAESGLPDNSVFSLLTDDRKNLWACTNSGIALVEVSSPVSFFNEKNNLKGRAICSYRYKNQLYIGNFQGVQVMTKNPSGKNIFKALQNSPSQMWAFKEINGDLFMACSLGIAKLKNGKCEIIDRNQNMCYSLGVSRRFPGQIIVGHEKGVSVLRKESKTGPGVSEKWRNLGNLKGIHDGVFMFAEDESGDIWMTPRSKDLLRIHFTGKNILDFTFHRYNAQQGLPPFGTMMVQAYEQQILVGTSKGLFRTAGLDGPPEKVQFELDSRFGPGINQPPLGIQTLCTDPTGHLWLNTKNGIVRCLK